MQPIIIDRPYRYVPPVRSRFWPKLLSWYLPRNLRTAHGFASVELRGVDRLHDSLQAGHAIILAPNHSRPCDHLLVGTLMREVRRPVFMMASWHLFMQSRLQTFILRRVGAFSVYREGLDKAALAEAIGILERAERPLVLFPEGLVSRTNERLNPLMDGVAFIARAAARKRAKLTPPGLVVIHPVALNYFFEGDLSASVEPVLRMIEERLSWRPQTELSLIERVFKLGEGLLSLKETEYLGAPRSGPLRERLPALIDRLLAPLEKEYRQGAAEPHTATRVKKLRQAIVPEMAATEMDEAERARRWRQLADIYLAQQLDCYAPDYVHSRPTVERILETVERFEEDLTDVARIHRPMRGLVEVGQALPAPVERERGADGDALTQRIEAGLREMIERNAREGAHPYAEHK